MPTRDVAEESLNRCHQSVADTPEGPLRVIFGFASSQSGRVCGVRDVSEWLTNQVAGPVKLCALHDGDAFEAGQIIATLEGQFGELVTSLTTCRGLLSLSAAAGRMHALVQAAGPVQIVDGAAPHHPPELIEAIAQAGAVGGAAGTVTRQGYEAVHEWFGAGDDRIQIGARPARPFRLHAASPALLQTVFDDDPLATAQRYHERCPDVPLSVRVGAPGRERAIVSEAVKTFAHELDHVVLDIPDDCVHEGGHDTPVAALEMRILSKAEDRVQAQSAFAAHGFGAGLTIEAVYAIRDLLDAQGARATRIVVEQPFDGDRLDAFRACRAPIDVLVVRDWVREASFECVLLRVQRDGQWVPANMASQIGLGGELPPLPTILEKA